MKKKIAYDPEFVAGADYIKGPKLEHVAWIVLAEVFIIAGVFVGFVFWEMWQYCN